MPETTVLIKNAREATTKGGKPYWFADDDIKSWSVDLTPYEGQQCEIEYTDNEYNGRQQKIVSKVSVAKDTPTLGTGEYQRAKTAKDDQIAINSRKALEEAVKSLSHTVRPDSDLSEYISRVSLLHSKFYLLLSGFSTSVDEDIPF